LLFESIRFRSN